MLLTLRRCRSVWNDACIVLRESCVAGGGLPLEKWVDELVGEVRAGGSHLSYRSSLDHGLSDSDVVRAAVPIKRPPVPIVVDPPPNGPSGDGVFE